DKANLRWSCARKQSPAHEYGCAASLVSNMGGLIVERRQGSPIYFFKRLVTAIRSHTVGTVVYVAVLQACRPSLLARHRLAISVFGWVLDVINNEHLRWNSSRFQPQAELVLDGFGKPAEAVCRIGREWNTVAGCGLQW